MVGGTPLPSRRCAMTETVSTLVTGPLQIPMARNRLQGIGLARQQPTRDTGGA